MKQFIAFLTTLLLLAVSSCSSEEPVITESRSLDNDSESILSENRTPEEAIANVQAFLNGMSDSRALIDNRRVKNVQVLRKEKAKKIFEKDSIVDFSKIDHDSLLYFLNFENDEGFAIAGVQRNSEPVYAIVESGNFEIDNSLNAIIADSEEGVMRGFVEGVLHLTYVTKELTIDPGPVDSWHVAETRLPLLETKWGQGYNKYHKWRKQSYGMYCPNFITGCVITAAAQIFAFYKTPLTFDMQDGQSYQMTMDWYRVIGESNRYDGHLDVGEGRSWESLTDNAKQSLRDVANLCRYLGKEFKADYRDIETGAKSKNFVNWVRNKTTLKISKIQGYNAEKIANSIRLGNVVYARGKNQEDKGHAWVYDGYIRLSNGGAASKYYIHCNWGWHGSRNGYYYSEVFDTAKGPVYDEDGNLLPYTKPIDGFSNFKHSLEIATISR